MPSFTSYSSRVCFRVCTLVLLVIDSCVGLVLVKEVRGVLEKPRRVGVHLLMFCFSSSSDAVAAAVSPGV